jgi:hypothetical protein
MVHHVFVDVACKCPTNFRVTRVTKQSSLLIGFQIWYTETQSILCINEDMREMSPDHDSLAVVDIQSGLRNLHATT